MDLQIFDRDVLALLPNLKQMAEDVYRSGKTGLLELLDCSRSRTEIHLELLDAEIESELDILMASGLLAATFENCSKQKSSGKKNMHLISFDYLRGVQYCF